MHQIIPQNYQINLIRLLEFKWICLTSLNSQSQLLHDTKNMLSSVDPRHGRYLTACLIFRDNSSLKQLQELSCNISNKNSSYFVEWIPNNIKYSLCQFRSEGYKNSAILLGNSTSIRYMFKRFAQNYQKMLQKRVFSHWYTQEGMDFEQFTDAQENINNLIEEYKQYENMSADQDFYDQEQQF